MSRTLPLRARHEALGARWIGFQGWELPASYGEPRREWEDVRRAVGLIDLSFLGILRIVGRDRRTWLHGMVTNEVRDLAVGHGNYAAILNVQGHMLSDLRIYAREEALLLELPAATKDRIAETLDHYLVMEEAEIEDATGEVAILSLQGPGSAAVAAQLGVEATSVQPLEMRTAAAEAGSMQIARVDRTGEVGFDVWVPVRQLPSVWDDLLERVQGAGGGALGLDALNTLRVEAGIPWWGAELDESLVPFEARLESAISLTKGCYIGQEIIARIVARGQVNNLMVGFSFGDIAPPPPGTPVIAGERQIGRVTSAVRSPGRGETIGLGFVRREHAAPGTSVRIATEGHHAPATVAELPFMG